MSAPQLGKIRAITPHPDIFGFVPESEAAALLGISQKTLSRRRKEGAFEHGSEIRFIGGRWRFSLNGIARYHEDQGAPDQW